MDIMAANVPGTGSNHNIASKAPKEFSALRTRVEDRRLIKTRRILVMKRNKQRLLLINSNKGVCHN